jgi:hypothetical protein
MSTITPTPTQVKHPFQAAKRTFLQVLLSVITIAGLITVLAPELLPLLKTTAPTATPTVISILAGIAVVSGVYSRITAIPVIDQLLTKIGFGSLPKSIAGTVAVDGSTIPANGGILSPPDASVDTDLAAG